MPELDRIEFHANKSPKFEHLQSGNPDSTRTIRAAAVAKALPMFLLDYLCARLQTPPKPHLLEGGDGPPGRHDWLCPDRHQRGVAEALYRTPVRRQNRQPRQRHLRRGKSSREVRGAANRFRAGGLSATGLHRGHLAQTAVERAGGSQATDRPVPQGVEFAATNPVDVAGRRAGGERTEREGEREGCPKGDEGECRTGKSCRAGAGEAGLFREAKRHKKSPVWKSPAHSAGQASKPGQIHPATGTRVGGIRVPRWNRIIRRTKGRSPSGLTQACFKSRTPTMTHGMMLNPC